MANRIFGSAGGGAVVPWLLVDSYPGSSDDARMQAAINAAVTLISGGATGVVLQMIARTYLWTSAVPNYPAGLAGKLIIRGAGVDSTTVKLSAAVPRFLDNNWTTTGVTFQNLILEDFTVDANNIDGPARGPATSCTGNQTISPSTTTNITVASTTGWYTGAVFFFDQTSATYQHMHVSVVNSTTLAFRNDSANTMTVHNTDIVTGACVDHVVYGTLRQAGSIADNGVGFNNITVRRIKTINVPTSETTLQTTRVNLELAAIVRTGDPRCDVTNILIDDVDFTGGGIIGADVLVRGSAASAPNGNGGLVDNIHVRRLRHDTQHIFTNNLSSCHLQVIGNGWGGRILVEDCWGSGSADVGYEFDSAQHCVVKNCVAEDAWGGSFFCANFAGILPVNGGSLVVNSLNGAINNSIGTITLHSTAGLPPFGYVYVDNEIILYNTISGNNLQNCVRGAGTGIVASHSDGAVIRQYIPGNPILYENCLSRRSRYVPAADVSGMGWYGFQGSSDMPPPGVRIHNCTYYRSGTDCVVQGEAIHFVGSPYIEVDGLTANVEGINEPTLSVTPAKASLMYLSNIIGNGGAATDRHEVVAPVILKNIHSTTTGIIGSSNSVSPASRRYAFLRLDKGIYNLAVSDCAWVHELDQITATQSCMFDFSTNPTLYLEGYIKNCRLKQFPGDFAFVFMTIPSTSFAVIRRLVVDNIDLRDTAPSSWAPTTTQFSIDSTNSPYVVITNVIPPTSVTQPPFGVDDVTNPYDVMVRSRTFMGL